MSPEQKDQTPQEPDAPARPSKRGFLGLLNFLLSLTALSISGWLVYELVFKQPDLLGGDVPATTRKLTSEVTHLKKLAYASSHNVAQLQENQKTLTEALRQTSQHLGKTRVDWVMAETEQLMIIANERLQLAADLETATVALQIADQRLRDLSDPDLTPVRKILAKEILALKSAERADLAGITSRLGGLAESVSGLPLSLEFQQVIDPGSGSEDKNTAAAKSAGSAGSAGDKQPGFFAELWGDIMSAISIRTNVDSYKPLLPPQQQYFLRENLRLMILGAQQAALRGDHKTYVGNLKEARKWTNDYFDTRTKAIAELIKELDALSAARLASAQPGIGTSLKALRAVSRKKAGL